MPDSKKDDKDDDDLGSAISEKGGDNSFKRSSLGQDFSLDDTFDQANQEILKITEVIYIRDGVFAIIYEDQDDNGEEHLGIYSKDAKKPLYQDYRVSTMAPFGYSGGNLEYLIVQKKKELYCLNMRNFKKTVIDTLTKERGLKYTGMCTYVEEGEAKIAVIVDFTKFMLYSYQPLAELPME